MSHRRPKAHSASIFGGKGLCVCLTTRVENLWDYMQCDFRLYHINNYVRTFSPVLGTSKFCPSVLEAIERSLKHECVLIRLEKCWQIFYVFSPECSQML